MKVNYFLQDLDGDELHWKNVATNTEIPVDVDSIIYASTETPGEYELNVFLRSRVAKPTAPKSMLRPREQGAELEQARRERDSLGRRCAVRFGEAEEARAEASQARDERDAALAEVDRLRKLIEPLREWRALWHHDSTPYSQERALIAAVDAYEDHIGGNVPSSTDK